MGGRISEVMGRSGIQPAPLSCARSSQSLKSWIISTRSGAHVVRLLTLPWMSLKSCPRWSSIAASGCPRVSTKTVRRMAHPPWAVIVPLKPRWSMNCDVTTSDNGLFAFTCWHWVRGRQRSPVSRAGRGRPCCASRTTQHRRRRRLVDGECKSTSCGRTPHIYQIVRREIMSFFDLSGGLQLALNLSPPFDVIVTARRPFAGLPVVNRAGERRPAFERQVA